MLRPKCLNCGKRGLVLEEAPSTRLIVSCSTCKQTWELQDLLDRRRDQRDAEAVAKKGGEGAK